MAKQKTLGDFVYEGKHELVAFVRDAKNIEGDEDSGTQGNRLGISRLGVLVCDRKTDGDCAHFFYKVKPRDKKDVDIARAPVSYKYSRVVSEFPLAISSENIFGWNFGNERGMYEEAKKLLKEHGLY